MNISESQLEQYKDEGYTVVRGLVSRDEAASIRKRLMDFLNGDHDWPANLFHVIDPSKYRNAKGGPIPNNIQQPAKRDTVFRSIAEHANLQNVMTQLLGGPVKLFADQAILKCKDVDGQSFYHQDSYYWQLKPAQGCNSWIALDEVGKGAIALAVMPGSQKSWTLVPHEEYSDDPSVHFGRNGQSFKRFRIPSSQVDFSREVVLPMSPGDAAFFSNFTWHRAEPNQSGDHKFAYAVAYQLRDS